MAPTHPTDSMEDLDLTPGHFLIGRPFKAPPCKPASTAKITSLMRWALVNHLTQDLWTRWLSSYLQSRVQMSKWHQPGPQPKPGNIVFIKDEVLRYREWPLAKIVTVYPGDDGQVRAVKIMCRGKELLITSFPSYQWMKTTLLLLVFPENGHTNDHLSSASNSLTITLAREDVRDYAPTQD